MFRLILALHDIGKPEAISNGGKHLQHRYTKQYIKELFRNLNIDEYNTNLAIILISDDTLGKYIKGKISKEETRGIIKKTQ